MLKLLHALTLHILPRLNLIYRPGEQFQLTVAMFIMENVIILIYESEYGVYMNTK